MRTTRTHRRRGLAIGLAAGALVLTGCGGGSDDGASVVEAPVDSSTGGTGGSVAVEGETNGASPTPDDAPTDAAGDTAPEGDASASGDGASERDDAAPGDAAIDRDDAAPDDAATDGNSTSDAATDGDATAADESTGGSADDGAATTSTQRDDGGVDLVGTEVGTASAIETNPFPDLVVDDLNRGTQVNLRNAIPGDRPVLLWFWAPH
jgi:hypothetical protein